MLPDSLLPLIEDLKTVPGIRAIVLGGSRARGSGDGSSDTDLGLYYDPESPLQVAALDQVAARHDDRKGSGLVNSIGGWGPWINGGGWLRVDGSPVDLLYRDTSKVGSVIDDCIAGQIEVAYQPGIRSDFSHQFMLGRWRFARRFGTLQLGWRVARTGLSITRRRFAGSLSGGSGLRRDSVF